MNTDSYFTIGKSHTVCEDYAIAGPNYVIVSDGCSSSPDTDFGARLLAKVCEQHILKDGHEYDEDAIIYEASAMAKHIGLDVLSLDATLMCAVADEDSIHVRIFGDGNIIYKSGDKLNVCNIRYPSNAPSYLSYRLNKARSQLYLNQTRHGWRDIADCPEVDGETCAGIGQLDSFDITLHRRETGLLILTSDGLESFSKTVEGNTSKTLKGISYQAVAEQVMDIKGFKGKFIERRCKKFLSKFCLENGWQHNDDLSAAGMHW